MKDPYYCSNGVADHKAVNRYKDRGFVHEFLLLKALNNWFDFLQE